MSDVLAELFGAIPLSKLLEALESDIDDLLWALEAPLGEAAYQRIIAAQRPARELAQTMRSRKNEVPLADAFRDAVLASDKLYNLLTPGAKARVSGHGVEDTSSSSHASPPPAPAATGTGTGATHAWDAAPPSYDEHHHHARSPSPPPPPPRAVPPPPRRVASPPPPPPPQRVVSPPPVVRYQPAPAPPVQRVLTPQPPPQRIVEVDVYIPEITSAAQLNEEVGEMSRPGGKALVILFMNPTSQTTREFLPQFARLVPEFKMARFLTLSVKSPGMEEVMETLSVALIPTVLTFCSDGFFRTTGKDLVSLRNDITRAVNDMAAMAIIKQWPRAQIDYNRAEALAFWRALPNQLQDVATLAAVDHGVRVKLLHTLPYVEDVDPNSYKALKDAKVMQHYCAHYFLKGETMYSCYDCGVNGEFADYCEKCWNNATHDGHTAIKRTAPHDNFICDCGRLSRTGSGDVIGAHCGLHQDQSQTDALATLLALSVLLGAR